MIILGRPGWVAIPGANYGTALDAYKEVGVDAVRVFVYHFLRDRFPYKFTGDPRNPDFKDEWDERWFDDIRAIHEGARDRGMKVIWTLVDSDTIRDAAFGGENKDKLLWWKKLWDIERFYDPEMQSHFSQFLDKLFGVIGKEEFLVETYNNLFFPKMSNPKEDRRYKFHKWLVEELVSRGISRERMMFSGWPNWRPFFLEVEYYSPHQIATLGTFLETLPDIKFINPEKIILSGDGGNGSGPQGPFRYRLMTALDGEMIGRKMKELGYKHYEYFDQSTNKNVPPFHLNPVKKIVSILKPVIPPTPEPPTPEPPPPPKPKTWWERFIEWLKEIFK